MIHFVCWLFIWGEHILWFSFLITLLLCHVPSGVVRAHVYPYAPTHTHVVRPNPNLPISKMTSLGPKSDLVICKLWKDLDVFQGAEWLSRDLCPSTNDASQLCFIEQPLIKIVFQHRPLLLWCSTLVGFGMCDICNYLISCSVVLQFHDALFSLV